MTLDIETLEISESERPYQCKVLGCEDRAAVAVIRHNGHATPDHFLFCDRHRTHLQDMENFPDV
jgi:hypothetical protein